MSPIKTLLTFLISAIVFWNCGSDSSKNNFSAADNRMAGVSLKMEYNATPLIDSLVLDCYGADTLHLTHQADAPNFSMELFPCENWIFKARLYANGTLMQMGELEMNLEAGSRVNLNIQMHAIVGFVYIEIPLGLSNAAGITRGFMTLTSDKDCYEIPMVQTVQGGYFKSGALNLGANYDIEITLFDKNDKVIYTLADKFLLTESSPVPNLTLQALRSQVNLTITPAPEKNVVLRLTLPATTRTPKADELLITEILAAPDSKDSTQYEFVELYNGSLDTLILEKCTIGLSNSNSIKHISIEEGLVPPNQAWVLGSPNSVNTPTEYLRTEGWNDLGNSKGTVVLKCNGETLDSLYYAPEADSLHPNVVPGIGSSKYGLSSQLNVDLWQKRSDSTAWKLAPPTPGSI